ncbi:MAG: ribonuclease, partial [Actinomycetota bacterium]
MNEAQLRECAEVVGHDFVDWSLLESALTHSSFTAENPDEASNERLEYLGDAVLGLVLADEMFRRHPDFDEGLLTDLRKSVVNETTLGNAARRMGLGRFIRLGRGEEAAGGHDKTSILSNPFEAVIGAVQLDAGTEIAPRLSLRLLRDEIAAAVPGLRTLDPKTQLQELTQDLDLGSPS